MKARTPVNIIFDNPGITSLFSELVESMGVSTSQLRELSEIQEDTQIITEPNFFRALSEEQKLRCLVVGETGGLLPEPPASISQPLTQQKVEEALSRFLGS